MNKTEFVSHWFKVVNLLVCMQTHVTKAGMVARIVRRLLLSLRFLKLWDVLFEDADTVDEDEEEEVMEEEEESPGDNEEVTNEGGDEEVAAEEVNNGDENMDEPAG